MKSAKVWTIGHSSRPLEGCMALLQKYDIQTIVDCRTYPRSRRSPWYNSRSLLEATKIAGVSYELRGNNLGGLGENVDYQQTIDEYVRRAKAGKRIAILCSEASPDKCHRKSMLTPSFIAGGLEVHHILWSDDEQLESEQSVLQERML
jgi:uncharacterized protein (DUF488 family)